MSDTTTASVTIPQVSQSLYFAILKVQSDGKLDWRKACDRAAILIDKNTSEFERLVKDGARRRANSEFMQQVNKAKSELREQIRANEDNFRVPCPGCKRAMRFSSADKRWNEEKKVLYKAFENWRHTGCEKK